MQQWWQVKKILKFYDLHAETLTHWTRNPPKVSLGHTQNHPKVDLKREPEQSLDTTQAKNCTKSESFERAPPWRSEKGTPKDLQNREKTVSKSDMSHTLVSNTFLINFWPQKAVENRLVNKGRLIATRYPLTASFSLENSSQEWTQACQNTPLKTLIFTVIYSSFKDSVFQK